MSFTGYKSTLAVKVNATRRWSAVASEYWITISPDNYPGVNESFIANVAVTVSDNATGQPREGHVTFFLQDEEVITLTVKQSIQDEGERPDEEFPITWANLQWCAASVINEGDDFEAGSCVFADGITNSVDAKQEKKLPAISVILLLIQIRPEKIGNGLPVHLIKTGATTSIIRDVLKISLSALTFIHSVSVTVRDLTNMQEQADYGMEK